MSSQLNKHVFSPNIFGPVWCALLCALCSRPFGTNLPAGCIPEPAGHKLPTHGEDELPRPPVRGPPNRFLWGLGGDSAVSQAKNPLDRIVRFLLGAGCVLR